MDGAMKGNDGSAPRRAGKQFLVSDAQFASLRESTSFGPSMASRREPIAESKALMSEAVVTD